MALTLVRAADECKLVHADDPTVTAPAGVEGWFVPVDGVPPGATWITVRALNGWQMLEAQQAVGGDLESNQAAYVREVIARGLVNIDGSKEQARAFVQSPSLDHLFGIFNAIAEAGAHPFDHGPGSDSIGLGPINGATPAAQSPLI